MAKDSQAQHDKRVRLHAALKDLYDKRNARKADLTAELNAYFDAYEEARKEVIAGGAVDGEKVGGVDKLRQDQGDARDFLEDNLVLLHYGSKEPVGFTYNIFTNDNSTKVFTLDDVVIGFTIKNLLNNAYSVQDIYDEWRKPTFMGGTNQVNNNANVPTDSNRYYVFREPATPSLFLAALRFTYDLTGKPAQKLATTISPSEQITIKTKAPTNITQDIAHNYKLRAVAIHHGSLGGGHYYAYVYNYQDKRWEKYNDREASVVDKSAVVNDANNSYLFLYELAN